VGATVIPRRLRPVSYQSMPDEWLSEIVRESNPRGIIRRIDGTLRI
jgi:hypothetical protein